MNKCFCFFSFLAYLYSHRCTSSFYFHIYTQRTRILTVKYHIFNSSTMDKITLKAKIKEMNFYINNTSSSRAPDVSRAALRHHLKWRFNRGDDEEINVLQLCLSVCDTVSETHVEICMMRERAHLTAARVVGFCQVGVHRLHFWNMSS